MRKELKWKKGIFSNTYQISDYRRLVGLLKVEMLRSNASGEINGEKYIFKSQGILSRTVHVIHYETYELIASIKMGFWGNKAQITTEGRNYIWEFKNLWQTKWSISDEKKTYLAGTHNNLLSKGNLAFGELDDFLVLTSIYVKDYLIRRNSEC